VGVLCRRRRLRKGGGPPLADEKTGIKARVVTTRTSGRLFGLQHREVRRSTSGYGTVAFARPFVVPTGLVVRGT